MNNLTYEDKMKGVKGVWEVCYQDRSYATDNPREAVWLANMYDNSYIIKHEQDDRECIKTNSGWRVQY